MLALDVGNRSAPRAKDTLRALRFGRRLALFFVLIALVPTLALIGMLVIVSEDSRRGKADARLAAGVETALAVYDAHVAEARNQAEELAASTELGQALSRDDQEGVRTFTTEAVSRGSRVSVEVSGPAGALLSSAGAEDAIAFGEMLLTSGSDPSGVLRVSTTTAQDYAGEVRRLTHRELVISRGGRPVTATVSPPQVSIEDKGTADVEVDGTDYRAYLVGLDRAGDETLLLLGPRKEGGFFTVDRPAAVLLLGFLALGVVLAYTLARTLTGLHARVEEQAITDSLTNLWNRRRMEQLLEREVERAARFGHEISFLIVDVDDFKSINDAFGHVQGDTVLQSVAASIGDATRVIDLGARYGGDELALILLETGRDGAKALAERLRKRISETEVPMRDGGSMHVTVSIGAATIPSSAETADDLVEAADQALLRAKRTGKDRIRIAPKRDVGKENAPE